MYNSIEILLFIIFCIFSLINKDFSLKIHTLPFSLITKHHLKLKNEII